MAEKPKTFWDGKSENETEILNNLIPVEGPVFDTTRVNLEIWRKFQNCYYDIYNNGFCNYDNLKDDWETVLKSLNCGEQSVQMMSVDFVNTKSGLEVLEIFADILFGRARSEHMLESSKKELRSC